MSEPNSSFEGTQGMYFLHLKKRAREHMGAGVGLGALSVGAAAVGAVCPLCVVAVPALIGSGIYNHFKSKKVQENEPLHAKYSHLDEQT